MQLRTPNREVVFDSAPELPRRALEQAGVEFIDAEKGGPGVRLRAPSAQK
jgi:hypothetical protein